MRERKGLMRRGAMYLSIYISIYLSIYTYINDLLGHEVEEGSDEEGCNISIYLSI